MNSKSIDLDYVQNFIGERENRRLEFKRSELFMKDFDKTIKTLTKTVSSFANSEGGKIVIGVIEKEFGKTRIADQIDSGVPLSICSPERLQQAIEGNLSPYLPGIKFHPIEVNKDPASYVYVICVPQGNTAYQASDFRYYGRSEYEAKPLPDHEIRLRMFRGKLASAEIRFGEIFQKRSACDLQQAESRLKQNWETFAKFWDIGKPTEQRGIIEYLLGVDLINIGELDIEAYKVNIQGEQRNSVILPTFSRTGFHGEIRQDLGDYMTKQGPTPKFGIIFPEDKNRIGTYSFIVPEDYTIQPGEMLVQWAIYLHDTMPCKGLIDLFEEVKKKQNFEDF